MRTYSNQFPRFILDVKLPDNFQDNSWGNDTMPCWINDNKSIILHIDYLNIQDREIEGFPRFFVSEYLDPQIHLNDIGELLIQSDDWQEIENFINSYGVK